MSKKPAEVFHPAEFVKEEMDARGWSPATLAKEAMLSLRGVEELLAKHIRVTPIIAHCLSMAFGTTKEFWLNLQRSYDESRKKP